MVDQGEYGYVLGNRYPLEPSSVCLSARTSVCLSAARSDASVLISLPVLLLSFSDSDVFAPQGDE